MPAATKDTEKKIETLREKIRHHEHLYYVLDNPEINDLEFDKLMQELQQLEADNPKLITPDSPTQRVGGKPREGFIKVRHSSPMLSLDNTYSEEELRAWERRVHELSGRKDVDYVCELKLDPRRWHRGRRRHAQCAHRALGAAFHSQRKVEEGWYPAKFRSAGRTADANSGFQEAE